MYMTRYMTSKSRYKVCYTLFSFVLFCFLVLLYLPVEICMALIKMDYFTTAHILLATAQNVLQLPISATAAH